jgi:hypothetical protein
MNVNPDDLLGSDLQEYLDLICFLFEYLDRPCPKEGCKASGSSGSWIVFCWDSLHSISANFNLKLD